MSVIAQPTPLPNGGHALPKAGREDGTAHARVDIIDIRRAAVELNLKSEILDLFHPKEGARQLPTLLLYDERGLQLFEEITYLDEYYLTNDEIAVLTSYAAQIAERIPSGSMVIELGSGNLRKVNLLLQAFEDAGKPVDYYALDLDKRELQRTLGQLPGYKHVRAHGLHGTYDDGREWLRTPLNASRTKCILSLGSSIGNFGRAEASQFLRGFADILGPGDTMLIGVDACNDPARVYHAYNDREGLTHQFVLNGLAHANQVLGHDAFKPGEWKVIGEYVYDAEGGRHQAFFSPIHDTHVLGEVIRAHERIQVEQSLKYSAEETETLWRLAGMVEVGQWRTADEYGLHLVAKPIMSFSLNPSLYAGSALPTLEEFEALWKAWDIVTRQMLPTEELLDKPIKLRNACIFYLGHIPTFLDIQLTKTTKESPTDPAYYYQIFERGIDPDVDNPENCHSHSEIPDEWPPLADILTYQNRVRDRIRAMYAGGVENIPRDVARAVWVGFEHEVMHMETLLYMMLQSDKTLPPAHLPHPDFEQLAAKARSERVPNEWFEIPRQEIIVGMHDPEDGTDPNVHFGWDNEKPERRVTVESFQAQGRPITNEEYAKYMYDNHINTLPASWAEASAPARNGHTNGTNGSTNGHANGHSLDHVDGHAPLYPGVPEDFLEGKSVRTVYGLVPLKFALDWPVFASYDELAGCASWMGGRIPTFEETRSIYAYVDVLKKEQAERKLGKTVPAVNGHLSNNGVQETPPSAESYAVGEAGPVTANLFTDLEGANVGFTSWHQVPVTANGNRLAGQGEMGGVWEWTSTVLRKWDGFEPMALYPLYTTDFFDEKHNIVLGGSWATHPRIAGRRSFVNWYQRNYPYPWVGARLVRDLEHNSP